MKTVLVTGAGGYIGSILVPKLLSKGYKVKALDRYFFGEDKLQNHENLIRITEDSRHIDESVFEGVYAVIDLVAVSNDPSGEIFQNATMQINHESRARTAKLAKKMGVKRYLLPSSCSIYGFQEGQVDETAKTNPLTTYAKANEMAEFEVFALANDKFCATVIRQATVFGYSPRMRFDLAINGMTYGAWSTKKLPLMRDGSQYRPMVHVQDTTDVMCLIIESDHSVVNGELFNVGNSENNYQIGTLGEKIAKVVGEKLGIEIAIEWYGDPDPRSYNVNFDKIVKKLGWTAQWNAEKGAADIVDKLESGILVKNEQTITLDWYKQLVEWYKIIKKVDMYGGILNID